ncbi:MAG: hypothetical protein ABIH35_01935 [Patescibacteria group bacterium]
MPKLLATLLSICLLAGCSQTAEEELTAIARAKAIGEVNDLWQSYEDSEAGFFLQYPPNVSLGTDSEFQLKIESEAIETLAGPMGFTKETALANQAALADGEYGEEVDWPVPESKTVRNLGDLNAQEFMVLSRFEICDVTFERKLVFYYNDHQVVITVSGLKKHLANSMAQYFTTDEENCGEAKVWISKEQGLFYQDVSDDWGSVAVQNWFYTFEEIVRTIKFWEITTPSRETEEVADTSSKLGLLQGKWVAITDPKAVTEFTAEEKIDFYEGTETARGVFRLYETAAAKNEAVAGEYLIVGEGEAVFKYKITDLSYEALNLMYLPRGNILKYERQQQVVPVPGHGAIGLELQESWTIEIDQLGDLPPIIRIVSSDQNFLLLSTVLWREDDDKPYDPSELRLFAETEADALLTAAIETEVELQEITGPELSGYYFGPLSYKELSDDPVLGKDFKHVIRVVAAVDNLFLGVTLLSNSKESEDVQNALKMLGQIRHILD